MNTIHKFALSALSLCVMASVGQAAERKSLRDNSSLQSAIAQQQSIPSSLAANASQLVGLSAQESLKPRKSYQNNNGTVTTRYQQYFKGVPVIGDDIVITSNSGGISSFAHGAVLQGIGLDINDVSPKLSAKRALSIAKGDQQM